jgi:hypothetical protein
MNIALIFASVAAVLQGSLEEFRRRIAATLRDLREHMALIEAQATIAQFAEILAIRASVELGFDR